MDIEQKAEVFNKIWRTVLVIAQADPGKYSAEQLIAYAKQTVAETEVAVLEDKLKR